MVSAGVTENATTTFIDQAPAVKQDLTKAVYSDKTLPIVDQTIVDFMKKPYLVATGSWADSAVLNDVLTSADIGTLLLANNLWTEKLKGFNMYRGTAVLRVVLNTNPFQQGKLLLSFLPNESTFAAYNNTYTKMHTTNMTLKSQNPNVELDCRDASCLMYIPYTAPTDWFTAGLGYDWGKYRLSVLAPFKTGSGGETSCTYNVYLHFEDFEMAAPIVPQNKGTAKRKFNTKTFKHVSESEAHDMQSGIVSNVLSKGAKVASYLSEIPILNAVAKPVEWALNIGAGVAGAFGWSKPNFEQGIESTTRAVNRYGANCDGTDASFSLGLSCTNKVATMTTLSHTDEDEMSFAFLKKVPAYNATLNWTTAQAVGTSLLSKAMSPANCNITTVDTSGAVLYSWISGPPIGAFNRMFSLWRGSMDVYIKIAKTDFHSGRLQITWTPTREAAPTVPTVYTGQYALREIVDIRDGSLIKLNLPYMVNTKYIDAYSNKASGNLDIVVLNSLRAPETCANNVDLVIYYGGGDDFEFAAPSATSFSSGVPYRPQNVDNDVALGTVTVGNATVAEHVTEPAQLCIGEMFTSIKQILSRNSLVLVPGITNLASGYSRYIWPFFSGVTNDNTTITPDQATMGGDAFSFFSSWFAYYRGSPRITYITESGTNSMFSVAPAYASALTINATAIPNAGLFDSASPLYTFKNQPFAGVAHADATLPGVMRVPYYSATHCSLTFQQLQPDDTAPNHATYPDQPLGALLYTVINGGSGKQAILRSFSDDFQLGYFVGTTPQLITIV